MLVRVTCDIRGVYGCTAMGALPHCTMHLWRAYLLTYLLTMACALAARRTRPTRYSPSATPPSLLHPLAWRGAAHLANSPLAQASLAAALLCSHCLDAASLASLSARMAVSCVLCAICSVHSSPTAEADAHEAASTAQLRRPLAGCEGGVGGVPTPTCGSVKPSLGGTPPSQLGVLTRSDCLGGPSCPAVVVAAVDDGTSAMMLSTTARVRESVTESTRPVTERRPPRVAAAGWSGGRRSSRGPPCLLSACLATDLRCARKGVVSLGNSAPSSEEEPLAHVFSTKAHMALLFGTSCFRTNANNDECNKEGLVPFRQSTKLLLRFAAGEG